MRSKQQGSSAAPKATLAMSAEMRAFRLLFDPGNWFQFPKRLLLCLTIEEALLFAFLVGHSNRVSKQGDWFFCKMDEICKSLHISKDKQTRWMGQLQKKGVISIQWEASRMPSRRLIQIQWNAVAELLFAAEGPDLPGA